MNIVDEIIRELGMFVPDGKLSVKDLQEILAKASNRVAVGKKQLEELSELIDGEKTEKAQSLNKTETELSEIKELLKEIQRLITPVPQKLRIGLDGKGEIVLALAPLQ